MNIKKNMGNLDRIIRTVVALAAAALYFTNTLTGVVGTVALVVAAIFLLTSAMSFCPIYRLVGLSTCPASPSEQA
ncbi:MAG: DUF2892 domain-containing protein [Saprospiraceae bacterium]|nr:DUF2892 domain-containing protein [Saprospiraceae bacterium]MDW8230347.1 DUF2892 domain-containing protein [Saprospiraceae bacterium]